MKNGYSIVDSDMKTTPSLFYRSTPPIFLAYHRLDHTKKALPLEKQYRLRYEIGPHPAYFKVEGEKA